MTETPATPAQQRGRRIRRANRRRRLGLATEPDMPAIAPPDPELIDRLVDAYDLHPVGKRSGPLQYLLEVTEKRHFIVAFARAEVRAANSQNRLGQLWVVLTPLLNAAVYYLIFGILLQTSRGVENFPAFLVIGVFTMHYITRSLASGANSVAGNITMVRAFSFPRMVLPAKAIAHQLIDYSVATLVMLLVVIGTGEPITWYWLTLPVIVFTVTVFNLGIAMIAARYTSDVSDLRNVLPFVNRAWTYSSGVFFSIQDRAAGAPDWVRLILEYNPGNIYLSIMRDVLMETYEAPGRFWVAGGVWAVLAIILGYFIFWANEERYGRG